MTPTDERLTRLATTLDTLAELWEQRVTRLESRITWWFGCQMTWMTILIGVAIAVLAR
jgi:hypothetical protein